MIIETRRAPLPQAGDAHRLLAEPSAEFAPSTYDAEAGTVEVVWSTGAEVRRYDWWRERYYMEALDLKGCRMERLNAGAPLLLDHYASIRNVVGSIVPGSVRMEGKKGVATLRFDRSSEDGQAAEAKVAGGHVRAVSIGYSIHKTEVERAMGTQAEPDRVTVTDFEPYEISLVAVPADAGAGLRSHPAAPTAPKPTTQEGRMAERNQPGSEPENTNPPAPPAPVAERQTPKGATMEEVLLIAKRAGLGLEWIESMTGKPLDEVRDTAIDAVAARSRPIAQTPTPSGDDPNAIREALSDAIAVRFQRAHKPANDHYRKYAGWRISDMARALLEAQGERNLPRNPVAFAERAFHTTSDFPLLLSASANKMLLATYNLATPTYRKIGARKVFNDFKPHRFLRAGDFPNLTAVAENGEIQVGTIGESQELVTLATFGRRVRVTRQVLINDDLSAFGDFAGMIGRRVVDFENRTFYAVVNTASGAGPTLVTGNAAVFATAAGRANRAGTGGVIDVASIGAGRAAIMKQTSVDGLQVGILPSMLLCGPDYLTAAQQLTSAIQPQQAGNVNPFAGTLEPVGEASIPGNRWYLFADPEAAPVYIYGYLDGADGPQVTSGPVQGVDGFEVQVIHDFAAGAVDWRGGWFNPGA
jgi:phage head maturation protease